MGILILLAFFLLVVVGGAATSVLSGSGSTGRGAGAIAAAAGVLAFALSLIFSSVAIVGTSDVGIERAFGKTIDDLPPGIHLIRPWADVASWDGSVQRVSYGRDTNQRKPDHCLLVRIGGQQSACLSLTFTYKLRDNAADRLFRSYRGDQGRMQELLVVRTLDTDLNTQLETFSPIQAMAAAEASGQQSSKAAALSPYASLVVANLQTQLGRDFAITDSSLTIPYVSYDPATQARLNQFQTQVADTLIAQEAEKTAIAQAAAIRTLQKQLGASSSATVVAEQCFTTVLVPMVKAGMNPQGVNCWPGGGSASTVVVPRARG